MSEAHAKPALRAPAAHWVRGLRGIDVAWWILLLGAMGLLTVADVVILEVRSGYFSTGFNRVALDTGALVTRFLLAGLFADLSVILGFWAILIWFLRRTHLAEVQVYACVAASTASFIAAAALFHHRLGRAIGEIVGAHAKWVLAEGAIAPLLLELLPELISLGLYLGCAAALAAPVLYALLVLRIPNLSLSHLRGPRPGLLAAGALLFAAATLVNLAWTSAFADPVREGLRGKPSAGLLAGVFEWGTDVDRDGYGLLSRPADPAPFDSRIHPHAIDWPGNGLDENRLGGDHPVGILAPSPIEVEGATPSARPDVLLVYLESFRDEVIDARWGAREVTPFLKRLAEEGGRSSAFYVHTPLTILSRAQLFCGCLAPRPGQRTLIDDFRELGYRVAHFSGQDESFGGSQRLLGWDRADVFYDARRDAARRTSRSAHPSSLQVSAKTLNQRIFAFLEKRDSDDPLFLYANFVDTHFPYHHNEIEDLLGVDPLARADISASNRERLWQTYLNTAANVDAAVEALVLQLRRLRGRNTVVVVTADHGESLYDSGYLGHGRDLDARQTRVPLIVTGLAGEWPEPAGASDLRGLILNHLASSGGEGGLRPRFVPDPEGRVLQFTPSLDQPSMIGLRGPSQVSWYDFRRGRFQARHAPDAAPEQARIEELVLIWSWEASQRAAAAAHEATLVPRE